MRWMSKDPSSNVRLQALLIPSISMIHRCGGSEGASQRGTKRKTRHAFAGRAFLKVAGWTGLEPAASGVTGRRSNQLNYHPVW